MDPEELAAAYVGKAEACVSAGKYEESLGLYDRAIEVDPECGEAWTGKANALKMLGRLREALDCLERSIEIWPSPIAEALRETLIGELRRKGLVRLFGGASMRIAIFGAGGAGGYYGARLARAGEEVIFIARGDHLRMILANGLRVDSVEGDFVARPAGATDDPAQAGTVDVVIVGVKTWQVPDAARAMRPMLGPGTFVVPLQNGVESPEQLSAVLGRDRVLGGLARVLSFVVEPGRLRHLGGPAEIVFGELDRRPSGRAQRLRDVLSRAGLGATIPEDIHVAIWEKFLFIVPIGGLGAVTRAPLGVLRAIPETRRMLEQGMREILGVAHGLEVPLARDATARTMAFVDTLPPDGTMSMQRDIAAGRPSELEAWNGAVVRLGRQAGVPTPLHDVLYGCLLPLERRARGTVRFAS